MRMGAAALLPPSYSTDKNSRPDRRGQRADVQLLRLALRTVQRVVVGEVALQPGDFFRRGRLAQGVRAGGVSPQDSRAAVRDEREERLGRPARKTVRRRLAAGIALRGDGRIGGQRLDVVEPHRLPRIAQRGGDLRPADHLGIFPTASRRHRSARPIDAQQARIAGGFKRREIDRRQQHALGIHRQQSAAGTSTMHTGFR